MVKDSLVLTVIEEHSLSPMGGNSDVNKSIVIPFTGRLPLYGSSGRTFFGQINQGSVYKEFEIGEFREHYGATGQNSHRERSFPAVIMNPFYMVWVEGREEWVGVKMNYRGSLSEPDGINEDIETSGPYKLDHNCGRLIWRAYDSVRLERGLSSPMVAGEVILRTSPDEFMEAHN